MSTIRDLLEWFCENYSALIMLLTVAAGLISYYVDRRQMLAKKLIREALWAKWIGLTYIMAGVGFWVAIQVALYLFGMR